MTVRLGVTGVLLLNARCSFVFVDGPPARHAEMPYVECSGSRVAPILDTLWTALQALNLLAAVSANDQKWASAFEGDPPFSRSAGIALYAVLGALGVGGMVYGYNAVAECKEAKDALMLRMSGAAGPPTWPPRRGPTVEPAPLPQN